MKPIDLKDILPRGQEYVLEYFSKTGKSIQGFEYDEATNTCHEKSDLIKKESGIVMSPNQIIKAVYLWDRKLPRFFVFVASELGTKENPLKFDQQNLSRIFRKGEYSSEFRKQMIELRGNGFPFGVENGTSSPFVLDHYFELGDGYNGFLEKIYFHDNLSLEGKTSDISLGGEGREWHKISAHLNYEDIYGCLNWKFPGRIEKFTL